MSPSVNVIQICRAKNRLKAEVQSLKARGERNKKNKTKRVETTQIGISQSSTSSTPTRSGDQQKAMKQEP